MSLFLEFVLAPGASSLAAPPRLPLGDRPLNLGRAPDSDVVLPDDTVSWQHATVWIERGQVRVRDRDSTNGTYVDEARVDREADVRVGQVLRLGQRVRLRVGTTMPTTRVPTPTWRLEVVESGTSLVIPGDGLRVGSGAGVDLGVVLDGVGAFVVRPLPDGAEILPDEGAPRRVGPGVAFAMGGLHFRVLPAA
ncbi:MAG: FHA domain-containing protein, partial [Myxococcota bacterium]